MQRILPASLGNDIVDLESEDTITHTGFNERVYTNSELEVISDSKELRWLFWTAKESAYKALKRILPELAFIPNKFEFNYDKKEVTYEDCKLFCNSEIANHYVYSYCFTKKEQYIKSWIQDQNISIKSKSSNPSVEVRELAMHKLSELLNCSIDELEIREHRLESKTNELPKTAYYPELWIKNVRSDHLLSFTHHGKFVALAVS